MSTYTKPDHWAIRAQKEGYPARSVYKLKEIDEKFGLLSRGRQNILDLGAAPGSWSLYVLRRLSAQKNGARRLSAIDLAPLSRQYDQGLFDRDNFHFLQGDMTSPEIREAIEADGPFSLILSDAAPATTGNRQIDTLRSLALAETVLDYAEQFLLPGGNLAVKVFQGGDTAALLARLRLSFKTARSFKPEACRAESFETYYLGLERF
ncbi:ribosomal RNA large subunit methyltransferase E [Spirochaetia bacterium]|nr:ribosomal RNA large subunit methyltransferase E [Spirochaetia bacterium]